MTTLRGWPPRRWAAAGVVLAVLLALSWVTLASYATAWWSLPAWAATAVLSAVVLASYLPAPGGGLRLDLGCTPCAAVAALTVLLAYMSRASAPEDPTMAGVALLLLAAGVRQRLAGGAACATPAGWRS